VCLCVCVVPSAAKKAVEGFHYGGDVEGFCDLAKQEWAYMVCAASFTKRRLFLRGGRWKGGKVEDGGVGVGVGCGVGCASPLSLPT
jgi:hypothetical protein